MKFLFETIRFLLKYIALNQQIIYLMTFHTYFTAFQISAPRRITNKISQIANSQQFGLFISLEILCEFKIYVSVVSDQEILYYSMRYDSLFRYNDFLSVDNIQTVWKICD